MKEHDMVTTQELLERARMEIKEWDVPTASAAIQGGGLLVLDVREADELNQGSLPAAFHVPRGMLEFKADPDYSGAEPRLLDRNQSILVYCKTGGRSALAAQTLKILGYTRVHSLAGGIEAWNAARQDLNDFGEQP